jgi:hypothetical protein
MRCPFWLVVLTWLAVEFISAVPSRIKRLSTASGLCFRALIRIVLLLSDSESGTSNVSIECVEKDGMET